jgi:hypothetical protein
MIAVLGVKEPSASTPVRWSAKTANVLYVDRTTRRCWLWLPPDIGNDNFVGIKSDSGIERFEIDHIQRKTTDGQLTYLVLEEHQLTFLEASHDFAAISRRPTVFPKIAHEKSAHDLVHDNLPDMYGVRMVAWFASGLATLAESPLVETLKGIAIEVIVAAHDQSKRAVRRDQRLFSELIKAIEERRLVFVLGGRKSGVSEFLGQFKEILPTQSSNGTHLTADFNGVIFSEISAVVRSSALMNGLNCEPDITSLFITLAYAAYLGLLGSDTAKKDSLALYVPRKAGDHCEQFVLAYLHKLSLIGSDSDPQVQAFIQFIGGMMKAAGRANTLTVILSISGFADWLREKRARDKASDIERSLWRALKSFTLANYDAAGQPRPGSSMYTFSDSIGIVVEIHRLAVAELAEGFCRHSVLIIPPYSDDELSRLWEQQVNVPATDDVLRYLREQTGGAPWFVQLLLRCVDASTAGTPTARLKDAAATARAILSGQPIVPTGGSLEVAKTDWDMYYEDLRECLSKARLERNTLSLLNDASTRPVRNNPNSRLPDWLESGLIWVRPGLTGYSLRAFENYPMIRTCPRGALLSQVIELLTSGTMMEEAS